MWDVSRVNDPSPEWQNRLWGPKGSRWSQGSAPQNSDAPSLALTAPPDLTLASQAWGALGQHRAPAEESPLNVPRSSCPAGLLYLCMKHITDRYNMYYSYAPTKLNEQIHMAAVYQAIFAPLLGLFWMLFFSILRLGRYQACRAVPPPPAPHCCRKPSTTPLLC